MGEKINRSFRSEFRGGLGLRPSHYPFLAEQSPKLATWFEVISENFMDSSGQPLEKLLQFRKSFDIALHGVSLGIGGPDALDTNYLSRLKALIEKVNPMVVSDHFCWTSSGGHYSHDLLPLPYSKTTLNRTIEKIDQVQSFLGRKILLENPSAYVMFAKNDFTETEFIREVCRRSGCGLLLDINNVYVSCSNFQWDASQYLREIPAEIIGQIHLAGFTDKGSFLFDTHSSPVADPVWALLSEKISELKQTPMMIEWDDEIPSFSVYEKELEKAFHFWQQAHGQKPIPNLGALDAVL